MHMLNSIRFNILQGDWILSGYYSVKEEAKVVSQRRHACPG